MEEDAPNSSVMGEKGYTGIKKKESRIDGINYSFKVAFTQQILNTWQTRDTLSTTIIWSGIVGIVFLTIGIVLLVLSNGLSEVSVRYDNVCGDKPTCSVEFTLGTTVSAPVYFYYELSNYHQNYRIVIDSFNKDQLKGGDLASTDLTTCGNNILNEKLFTEQSIGNSFLEKAQVAYPCGSLPKDYFKDTFKLFKMSESVSAPSYEIFLNSSGISYSGDASRYANLPGNSKLTRQWLDMTDERFMVWMRVSPTNKVRKLWAKVERSSLEPGKYRVDVVSRWSSGRYDSQKSVIITQVNSLGGKNVFMANTYIITGSISLLAFLFLGVRRFIRPRSILYSHLRRLRRSNSDRSADEVD